jgi:hypothetical protein
MRGGVVVFHGCGLKGEFFLFSCSMITMFLLTFQ